MTEWVTSDLHFNHSSMLKYCPNTRPYSSVEEMNEGLITLWNNKVKEKDLTYILGDVAFGNVDNIISILKRLNGKKILIEGNHDTKFVKYQKFRDCFQEVTQYKAFMRNGVYLVFFHFPIMVWDRKHYGSIHLFGHSHGRFTGMTGRSKDIGYEATGNIVNNLDEIINDLFQIEFETFLKRNNDV